MRRRLSAATLLMWCSAVVAGCTKTEDKQYYASGKLESVAKVKKNDDGEYIKDGLFVRYHENGAKERELYYVDDALHGKCVSYYESGAKQEEGQYENGEAEGVWTYYHENGRKMAEGQFERSKRVPGTWKQWNEDGSEKKQEERGGRRSAPTTDG